LEQAMRIEAIGHQKVHHVIEGYPGLFQKHLAVFDARTFRTLRRIHGPNLEMRSQNSQN
jgi:hypothetical protein